MERLHSMAYDCPFDFFISSRSKYCWVFVIAAAVILLIGGALFVYAFFQIGSMEEERIDLILWVASGCVTCVSGWLFLECYKHFKLVYHLMTVCRQLGTLNEPPVTQEKKEQIDILTESGWEVCKKP